MMVKYGGGLSRDVVTVQAPDGLGEVRGVEVRGGETQVDRPRAQSGQIHPNRRDRQSRAGAVSHKPKGVEL